MSRFQIAVAAFVVAWAPRAGAQTIDPIVINPAATPPPAAAPLPAPSEVVPTGPNERWIRMADGSLVRGRIEYWDADGTAMITTIAGEQIRTVPGIPSRVIVDVRTPPDVPMGLRNPGFTPGYWEQIRVPTLEPGPNRVPIVIRSHRNTVDVGRQTGVSREEHPEAWYMGNARSLIVITRFHELLCRSPCRLWAFPGPTALWLDHGPVTVTAYPTGSNVTFEPPRGPPQVIGGVMIAPGILGMIAGAIVLGIALNSYHPSNTQVYEGAGLIAGCAILTIGGIALAAWGGRSTHVSPLPPSTEPVGSRDVSDDHEARALHRIERPASSVSEMERPNR